MLLGIVGKFGTGKDELSNYLVRKYGFTHVSTGDFFRQEGQSAGIDISDRDQLRSFANRLRAVHGADYVVRTSVNKISGDLVISGIRAVAEAQSVLAHGGTLICLEADVSSRYEMVKLRKRPGSPETYKEFLDQDAQELEVTDSAGQDLPGVINLAQITIKNDYTEKFFQEVDRIIKLL